MMNVYEFLKSHSDAGEYPRGNRFLRDLTESGSINMYMSKVEIGPSKVAGFEKMDIVFPDESKVSIEYNPEGIHRQRYIRVTLPFDEPFIINSWSLAFDYIGEMMSSYNMAYSLFSEPAFKSAVKSLRDSEHENLSELALMFIYQKNEYERDPESYCFNLEKETFLGYMDDKQERVDEIISQINSHIDDLLEKAERSYEYTGEKDRIEDLAAYCEYFRDSMKSLWEFRKKRDGYAHDAANKRLLEAIAGNDFEKMRNALEDGANPNGIGENKRFVIQLAGDMEEPYIPVRMLLGFGAAIPPECKNEEKFTEILKDSFSDRRQVIAAQKLDESRFILQEIMEMKHSPSQKTKDMLRKCLLDIMVEPSVSFHDDVKRLDNLCYNSFGYSPHADVPSCFINMVDAMNHDLRMILKNMKRDIEINEVSFIPPRDLEDDLLIEEKRIFGMDVLEHAFNMFESPSDMAREMYKGNDSGPTVSFRVVDPYGDTKEFFGSADLKEIGTWEDMRRMNLAVESINVSAIVEGSEAEFTASPVEVMKFTDDWYDTYLSPHATKEDENLRHVMEKGYDKAIFPEDYMEHLAKGIRTMFDDAIHYVNTETDLFFQEDMER